MHLDTTRFRFIGEALRGDGGFRPVVVGAGSDATVTGPTYLIQYPRESAAKFARRNDVAWYANDLASACNRFAGYLSQRRPQRALNNDLLDALARDADWRGNSLDVLLSSFTVQAKARGSMLLLVDMPRVDDQADRAFPYLTPIPPEDVLSLEIDHRGRVSSVEIMDGDTIRGWDATSWWVRRGSERLEEAQHALGVCPVLAFSETDFPAFGEFAQIADLARRLFNLHSELDEILRSQTFSLLTLQVPPEQMNFSAEDTAQAIGTHNLLVHAGASPAFIAPPDGPAKVYLERIANLEEKIRRIGHMIEAPDRAESGIALKIRFQQLNAALSHWAGRMEDLERRVFDLACRWLQIPDRTEISWDDDYALTDIAAELESLSAMQMSGFSDAVLREKRKQIVSLDFATLEDEELAALLEAEDEDARERDPGDMDAQDDMGGEDQAE